MNNTINVDEAHWFLEKSFKWFFDWNHTNLHIRQ